MVLLRHGLWLAIILSFAVLKTGMSSPAPTLPDLNFVAHAGGAFNGDNYQNSIETLNQNYAKGFRYFELDFSWTSDGALVGIHDWEGTFHRLFEQNTKIPDLASFSILKMKNGSAPITFPRLNAWLNEHPHAWVVSDIKNNNLAGLVWIKENFPSVAEKTIPQIYATQEYKKARQLGYANIILTIYQLPGSAAQSVLELTQNEGLLAVTMTEHWFSFRHLSADLMDRGVTVCLHTINDPQKFRNLQSKGVSCIYTDSLISPQKTVAVP